MGKKRHRPEDIVSKLRQVEVLTAQGKTVAEAIRSIGVTEVTYYRWRSEYGGLKGDQVKRLKELEAENNRLRRAVSDLTIEKLILKGSASKTFNPRPSPCVCGTCGCQTRSLGAACMSRFGAASIHTAQETDKTR